MKDIKFYAIAVLLWTAASAMAQVVMPCTTTNNIPKITAPNTLNCSQYFDNSTTAWVGSSTSGTSYYLTNAGTVRNDSKLLVDMTYQGSNAGLMVRGGNTTQNWPTLGLSLTNGTRNILGASLIGQITSSTAGAETMDLVFNTKPAGNQIAENMRITSIGKVGIGTASPLGRLDVYRPVSITDANCIALNVHNVDKATGFFPGGTAILGTSDNNGAFSNTGVSGIASLGAVNVGVSGNATVATNASNNFGVMGWADGAGVNYGVYGVVGSGAGGRPNNCAGYFDGDVLTSSGNFLVSDAKLKSNVQDFKGSLGLLKKLETKTYDFKLEEYKNRLNLPEGNQIGIMAQNLQAVFPNLVREKVAAGRFDPVTHQKLSDDITFLAVNYVGLIPVLVQSVKELSNDLDQAKKENADLRNLVNDLCNSGCAGLRGATISDLTIAPNLLMQNVPNPFSGETTIGYVLNTTASAYMNINTLDGKMAKQIPLTGKGQGSVTISANEFGAGTYTYTLYVDGRVIDTKLMVISAAK